MLGFCLLFITGASAQSWLNKLGNAAKEAAKNTVERRVEQKAEEVTDKALSKAEESEISYGRRGGGLERCKRRHKWKRCFFDAKTNEQESV